MSEQSTDVIERTAEEHEHDDLDILNTPDGRALICHECRGPIQEEIQYV
jgi:hypothetical protein